MAGNQSLSEYPKASAKMVWYFTPECDQLSKTGEDSGRPEEQAGLRENIQG